MPLTLRIGPFERLAPGQAAERTLTSGRLTIGRAADNDVVLADPERVVSKHHCVIEGGHDSFRLADTSVNGVYVNAEPEPVGRGRSHQLRDGDRLRIGGYEITVELSSGPALGLEAEAGPAAEAAAEPPLGGFSSVTELFADDSSAAPDRLRPSPAAPAGSRRKLSQFADLERGAPIDEAFFAPRGRPPAPPEPAPPAPAPAAPAASAARSGGTPVIPTDWERPAAPPPTPAFKAAAPAEIPEQWWAPQTKAEAATPGPAAAREDRFPPQVPPPLPSPLATPAPEPEHRTASAAHGIAAFLRGAGLDPETAAGQPPDVLLERAGGLVRLAVEGVIALLEARRAVKETFRLEATQFRAAENNPLKFSADADAALAALLSPPRRGYLDAESAFREAFADLRGHEMALLAGMQQVWRYLMARFDPKTLETRVGEDSGLGGLIGSKKARCWDAFVTLHETLAGGADDELRLVERIFAEAYDAHVGRQRQDGDGSRR